MGTTIEWYDFFLYATAASLIFNTAFFPDQSSFVGTLLSFATFAVGFVVRPIGGVVFGHIGDRIGRKRTLALTMVLMGGATALMGLLLAVEHSAPRRRGFSGSVPQIGLALGLALGTGVFALLQIALPDDAFESYGWRSAFLISVVLVIFGVVVRLKAAETLDDHVPDPPIVFARVTSIGGVGDELQQTDFTHAHRRDYRRKVALCLDVFETMLTQSSFDFERPLTGMEIECNLVDDEYQPAMSNTEVLASIADPAYQTELGAYNIEFNVPPRRLPGRAALELESDVRASLNAAEGKANSQGTHIVMIGILPTLMPEHLSQDWMSESTRYQALNDSIFTARGEDISIDIAGPERLSLQTASIAPESACTSMQLHLQVSPADFADNWNAAQVLAGPQLALGANSPFFFGHQLWSETRIELFTQATDTRPDELKTQGVRPRVWFGERWITSIFDLFEENVRYFPSLLPELSDEDPAAELAAGRTPALSELRLHNGTIYRWNRPVYDVVDGRPHLRVENRVLPAGPTVVDMLANSAFYYGMLRTLSEEDRPVWTKLSFAAAHHNFSEAAQHGMDARLYWPGIGEVTPDELVLRRLLPMADEGLRRWGVAAEVRDRYLAVIEGRARTGRNGSAWQVSTVRALQDRGLTRPAALAEMLRQYCQRMHSNEPVHTWDGPD